MKSRINPGRILVTALLLGTVSIMAACNGSLGSSTGQLSLGVTDTPTDGVQSVVVAFTGVTLKGPDGTRTITFASEKNIDLLKLQGNASAALLQNTNVAAGDYQWIRLNLDLANSYVKTDSGNKYSLTVPSGMQTGLKLVSGFTVAQGNQADFMIDFNLRKALTLTQTGTGTKTYILRPALRLINMQEVGSVSGTAPATLTVGGAAISTSGCSPAVYVYSGTNTTPGGYFVAVSGGTAPVASGTLSLNNTTGNYDYAVGFLAPGGYTLAVTCAANDTTSSSALAFSAPVNATVTAGATATVNFPAP